MTGKRAPLVAGLLLAGMAIGFLVGSVVYAGEGEPGSAADPLVARSYVDEHMESYVEELEKQVEELSDRARQLETALAQLQKQVGLTPIQPGETGTGSGSSGGGTGSGTGSGGAGTGSQGEGFSPGQKLYILAENSAVNLRRGPGTGYEKVGTAVRGSGCEPMTVISRSGDWYQVRLPDGRTGWVAGWLMTAS